MKLAIVADIHGNLTALDAVLADLDALAPDRVAQGGDLVYGPQPAECLARVRERGWPGVLGNTDEMLWTRSGEELPVWVAGRLGEADLDWLRRQSLEWRDGDAVGLVHATPGDVWRVVKPDAPDEELRDVYGRLGTRIAVYAHIHLPYVRVVTPELTVVNTGSVGMPFDGDARASYLLITDGVPETRRVAYDVERAAHAAAAAGHPQAEQLATIYRTGRAPW